MESPANPVNKDPEANQAADTKEVPIEDALLHIIKEESHHKKYWLGFLITILVVIFGWAGLVLIFGRYDVGDRQLSFMSSSQSIRSALISKSEAYRLSVTYPNHSSKSFNMTAMGVSLNLDASVGAVKKLYAADLLMWWRHKTPDLIFNIDQSKFHDFIQGPLSITDQPAKDATIKIDKGQVVISNSTAGKRYGLVFPQDTIIGSANSLKASTIDLQLLAYKPTVTSKQLQPYETKLKKILSQKIVLKIASNSKVVSSNDIGSWLDVSFDKTKKLKIEVNSGKVIEYINNIAQAYIQEPKDEVDVKNEDGTTTVLAPGREGVDVVDKSKIAVDISDRVIKAEGLSEELPISTAPFKKVVAGDYAKWIVANVTEKKMYAYEHTKLVHTFLISSGAPRTPTVLGQYKIQRKYVQQDMFGQNADGTDYFQPHVPWVNYFYGGYAIHGNYWRPLSWFGRVNSSHGCIGVSVSDGKWIYDWAPVGTPLIIHT